MMMNSSNTNSTSVPVVQWQYSTKLLLIICVHSVNYIVGIPLQSCIMAVILHGCRRSDPSDVFIVNQAAAEISFMLFGPFHILSNIIPDDWVNKLLGLFLGVGMEVRSLLQCCVCLERYVAVVHPVTFLKFRAFRYRAVMCGLAWASGILFGITCMLTYPDMPYQWFGVVYFIILTINTFSCVSILRKLRRPGPGARNADRGMEDGAKKRAFQIVMMNLLTFVIQNTPLAILFGFLNPLPGPVFKMSIVGCIAVNLAVGWVQPVYMLHKAGKFS